MLFQVRVLDARFAARRQAVGYAQDDESSRFAAVEDAGAISESASFGTEFTNLSLYKIEDLNRLDGFGNFLTVSSYILNWGPAHAPRNAAQTLDSGTIPGNRAGHEPVPLFASSYIEERFAIFRALLDSPNGKFQDQARPARVRDHQVAAAPQHK